MILRIIDKETKLFLRDDFTFDENTEIGLDVEPSRGLLSIPKWENDEWIESGISWEILASRIFSINDKTQGDRYDN